MTPGDDVAAYLERVRAITDRDPAIARAIAGLEAKRDALSAMDPSDRLREALAHLSLKRLLASSTLRTPGADRLAWDDANRFLHERIGAEPWSIAELGQLNAVLSRGSTLRDGPIYSPPDEYLDASRIATELEKLESYVGSGAHPLLAAANVYIAVVTIHPYTNGNGRTSRLAADRVLLENGFLPLCFLTPIASHVAQLQGGRPRSPQASVMKVLDAVVESYQTVANKLGP